MLPNIQSAHDSAARNIINATIDSVNVQGKSIQDLVAEGQLTPTQYETLLKTINGLISKGEITLSDVDKNNFKIDQTFLTEELRRQMAGNAPINAVPADNSLGTEKYINGSVTASKMGIMNKSKNLFSGDYSRQNIVSDGFLTKSEDSNTGRVAVVPIQANKTYTIKVHEPEKSNRFRIATNNIVPTTSDFDNINRYQLNSFLHNNNTGEQYTFTNNAADRFLFVLVSIDSGEPKLQVEEGSVATDYVEGFLIDTGYIQTPPININDLTFAEKTRNLFNGEYHSPGILYYEEVNDTLYARNYPGVTGNTAIIPVSENQTYTIKVHEPEKSEVFRVGLWNGSNSPGFTSGLDVPMDKTIITSNTNNPKKDEVTFTTESETRFVLIYVSNSDKRPKMQMELGEKATNYVGYHVIKSDYLDVALPSSETTYKGVDKYNVIGTLDAMTVDDLEGYYDDPNTVTPQEYHNKIIDLVDNHSDIASHELLGQDDFSNNLYKYEIKPQTMLVSDYWNTKPDETNGTPLEIPKIIITSGVHGQEKNSNYVIYYFMKKLLENREDNSLFTILSNVHLIFIPLICPSGFIDNTYENRNGINLNRDFPPYGNETQPESKLVKKVLDENSDADYHIDFHNHGAHRDLIGYSLTDSEDLARITTNAYKYIGNRWQIKESGFPQERTYQFGYTSAANIGTVGKYTYDELGIPSAIIETTRHTNTWIESVTHGAKNTQLGTDLLLNVILGILQSRR